MHLNRYLVACSLAAALPLAAQPVATPSTSTSTAAAPDTRSIIDALKPAPTRSLRNLVVRQRSDTVAAAASAAAPDVALAAVEPAASAVSAPAPTVPAAMAAGPSPSLSLAIQFEANSSRVRPESGPLLGNLVAALLSPELKGSRFAIEGHTDARGQPARNLALSQERADEVRLYLVALGVHPSRLKAVGKGASDPADPRDPASALNRRVRVVTLE